MTGKDVTRPLPAIAAVARYALSTLIPRRQARNEYYDLALWQGESLATHGSQARRTLLRELHGVIARFEERLPNATLTDVSPHSTAD